MCARLLALLTLATCLLGPVAWGQVTSPPAKLPPIHTLIVQGDTVPPNVLISPASGSSTNTPTVAVTISFGDRCFLGTTASAAGVTIVLNGQSVLGQFTYTGGGNSPTCAGVNASATGTVMLRPGVDTLSASIRNGDFLQGSATATYTYVPPVHAVRITVAAGVVNAPPSTRVTVPFTVTNIGNVTDSIWTKTLCTGYALITHCFTVPDSAFGVPPGGTYPGTASVDLTDSIGQLGRLRVIAYEPSHPGVTDTTYIDITVQARSGAGVVLSTLNSGTTRPRDKCLTIAIRPGIAYECGDLRVAHALPAVRTYNKLRAPALVYHTHIAHGRTALGALVTFDSTKGIPDTVTATVTDSATGTVVGTGRWLGATWGRGVTRRVTVRVNEGGLAPGVRWTATFTATAKYNATQTTQSFSAKETEISVSRWAGGAYNWALAGEEFVVPLRGVAIVASNPWTATTPIEWTNTEGDTREYLPVPGDSLVWAARGVDRPDTIKMVPLDGVLHRYAQHGAQVTFDVHGGHQLKTIDRLGHATTFADGANATVLVTVPSPSGGLTYTFYWSSGQGQLDSVLAPSVSGQKRMVRFGYTNLYELNSITDPDGSTEVFHLWFPPGNPGPNFTLVDYTDKRGAVTAFSYDSAYKLAKVVVDTGPSIVVAPAVPHLNLTTTFQAAESQGLTVPIAPDSAYTLVRGPRANQTCSFPLSPCPDSADVTRFWVDQWGEPRRIRDAHGYEVELTRANATYPALVTYVRFQAGRVVVAAYDARGNTQSETDSSFSIGGQFATTTYTNDARWDFLTGRTLPKGETWSAQYDTSGNRRYEQVGTDSTRRVRYFYYPGTSFAYGLLQADSTPLSPKDNYTYDATLANLVTASTPLGEQTKTVRDAVGRVIRTASPVAAGDSLVDSVAYDAMDRDTLQVTFGVANDHSQADTLIVRDTLNQAGDLLRVKRTSKPDRNAVGTLTTNFAYDIIGRRVTEIPPNSTNASTPAEQWAYDAAGNPVTHTTRRGYAITSTFDATNRLVRRVTPQTRPDSTEALVAGQRQALNFPRYPNDGGLALIVLADTAVFGYNALGALTTANNADAHISRSYYPNGNLRGDELDIRALASADFTSHVYRDSLGYDLDGRRTLLRVPANVAPTRRGSGGLTAFTDITYAYDPVTGALSTVTDPLGNQFTYKYDQEMRVDSLVQPGGITEVRRYDGDGRLKVRIERGSTTQYVGILSGVPGQVHWDSLSYDQRGRVLADHINGGTDSVTNVYALPDGLTSTYAAGANAGADPTHLCGWWMSDALGFRVSSQEAQQTFACNLSAIPHQAYYYQPLTGRLLKDSVTQFPQPGGRRDAYTDSAGNPDYDAAGNQRTQFTWLFSPVSGQQGQITAEIATMSFYGADERLRVVDQRKCLANSTGGPEPCLPPANVNASLTGPYDEYRYDALGRRVVIRTRVDTVSSPSVYGTGSFSPYSLSTIQRNIWDGDQLLIELRMPGSDTTRNLELDTTTVFDALPHFGRVLYVHGPGIDQPLDIVRTGYAQLPPPADAGDTVFYAWLSAMPVMPHWSWRGGMDDGSFTDGSEVGDTGPAGQAGGHALHYQKEPPPTGVAFVNIAWPDGMQGMFGSGDVPLTGVPSWFGSLSLNSHDATGAQYRRNRFYDPVTGRFTQEDPLGLAGGLNAYGFVAGDPVNYSDPFGLCPGENNDLPCAFTWGVKGLVIGGAGGAVVGGTIGSVVPGPGTLAGAGSGALVGGVGGLGTGIILGAAKDLGTIADYLFNTRDGDLPAKGKPNSSAAKDYGDGKGQIRDYGPDGKAKTDYDFGHGHKGAPDPHAHDWDWTQKPPRGPARPIGPNE